LKILFVIPYVPNLIRTRSFNFLKYLVARGNRVSLFTICTSENDQRELINLTDLCDDIHCIGLSRWKSFWNCVLALPTSYPLQAVYSWTTELVEEAITRIPEFDIVHVEHLRGAKYGLSLLERNFQKRPPIIWDSVDCISYLFHQAAQKSQRLHSRWLTRFELARTEGYERYLSRQFDRILVTSKNDKQAFHDLNGSSNWDLPISVVPNGVDLDYFAPNSDVVREKNTIVIVGKMSYHANVSMVLYFIQEIFPFIREKIPLVKLVIVGKDPPRVIRALDGKDGIEVTGTVDDVRPYLQRATVSVSPVTYGAGIQNKVLEAMACGTPVVATPIAVSALDAKHGKDLLVAEGGKSFADKVLHLLENAEIQTQIGNSGRVYVEENHHWNQIVMDLEEIYRDVIEA